MNLHREALGIRRFLGLIIGTAVLLAHAESGRQGGAESRQWRLGTIHVRGIQRRFGSRLRY